MKILKVFRRYNHVLLMVFMSLLLITFLIPQSVRGCGNQAGFNDPMGMAFGETFYQSDVQRASNDMEIVYSLGLAQFRIEPVNSFLLMEEARRLGVRVSRDHIKEELAAGPAGGQVSAVAARMGRSVDSVYDAIGRFAAFNMAAQWQLEPAALDSLPRTEVAYRDQTQEAVVQLSVIPNDAFLAQVAEPTEEEIKAHFDQGKDRITAHDDDGFKFGYRYSDRVAIEYLTVDPAKIKNDIRVSSREAQEHYDQNPTKYYDTVPRLVTPPSSQPSAPRFERRKLTFEEARERVKNDKRELKAAEAAQRLMNDVKRAAHGPWANAGMGEDKYLIVPAGVADISFEGLRERFSRKQQVERKYPVEYHKIELLDLEGLQQLDDISRAQASGSRGVGASFATMALRVKGLATIAEGDSVKGLNPMEPSELLMINKTALGQPSRPYQAFIFRVIQIAPAAPPASVDEVRDQVIEDLKLMSAHKIAKGHAERMLSAAQADGLRAAVAAESELRQLLLDAETAAGEEAGGTVPFDKKYADGFEPFKPTGKLTRRSFFDARVGTAGPLPEKVFELADQPAPEGGRRVAAVQLISSHKWVLVELEEVKPLYQEGFDRHLVRSSQQPFKIETYLFQSDWFKSDNIRARTRYEPPPRNDQPAPSR